MGGRFVIDYNNFESFDSHGHYNNEYTESDHKNVENYTLSEEGYLIRHHKIPAFSLSHKEWCWLDLTRSSEIDYKSHAFEQLLLPQEQKDMISALVGAHTQGKGQFDDMVQGKGKGLIFLLHGAPGLGKTLTAGMFGPSLF